MENILAPMREYFHRCYFCTQITERRNKMAKIIDRLKEEMLEEVLTETQIDIIMEKEKYYPIECDSEEEEGVLQYSNGKSEIWVKYFYADGEYLVSDVTMKTKKSGSTKTRHLTVDEIKCFMDYFREHGKYEEFMIFVTELLLARRISDTLSLEWKHFFYENGNRKDIIDDLTEEKTDKIARLHIPNALWKYIEWYCEEKHINPLLNYTEDIFTHPAKLRIKKYKSDNEYTSEYKKAVKTHAKAFRHQFTCAAKELGIKGVSTHSIRKSFGNIAHMINQFDPDCLDVLQSIYVHDSRETTKIYIDIIDDKAKKTFNDVADFVSDKDNGIEPCINNIPVVALKTNDLRNILLKAYNLGMENSNGKEAITHIEVMNTLISDVEKMRLQ